MNSIQVGEVMVATLTKERGPTSRTSKDLREVKGGLILNAFFFFFGRSYDFIQRR